MADANDAASTVRPFISRGNRHRDTLDLDNSLDSEVFGNVVACDDETAASHR